MSGLALYLTAMVSAPVRRTKSLPAGRLFRTLFAATFPLVVLATYLAMTDVTADRDASAHPPDRPDISSFSHIHDQLGCHDHHYSVEGIIDDHEGALSHKAGNFSDNYCPHGGGQPSSTAAATTYRHVYSHTHGYAHRHSHGDTYANVDPNGDLHREASGHKHRPPDGHGHGHSHAHPDRDAYANADTDRDLHSDPHSHAHSHTDSDTYVNRNGHADRDLCSDTHTHAHSDAYANRNPDSRANGYRHRHTDAEADTDDDIRTCGDNLSYANHRAPE